MGGWCTKVKCVNNPNLVDVTKNKEIYIIKCEHDKYYIGKSKNAESRIASHFQNNGSEWTKVHKPIEVISIFKDCDDFDEDKYTKKYMSMYGIENVRGGTYCQVELNKDIINFISKEINASQDKCFKCGKVGHFANRCGILCSRCGRNNHTLENCYARTNLEGELL